jgi:hypothetical protein
MAGDMEMTDACWRSAKDLVSGNDRPHAVEMAHGDVNADAYHSAERVERNASPNEVSSEKPDTDIHLPRMWIYNTRGFPLRQCTRHDSSTGSIRNRIQGPSQAVGKSMGKVSGGESAGH